MDVAYSIEYGKIIDAQRAYDLYWAGILSDKNAFECHYPGCGTSVICVNMDKPIQEMKRAVHFRALENHIPECVHHSDDTNTVSSSTKKANQSFKSGDTDVFVLERPKDYFKKPKTRVVSRTEKEQIKSAYHIENKDKKRSSRTHSIKKLVSNFYQLQKADLLDKTFISINGFKIPYSDFFIEIDGQEMDSLSLEYRRIYYQKAYINSVGEDKLLIRFNGKLSSIMPTCFIDISKIEDDIYKSYWKKLLEQKDSKRAELIVFIYATPYYTAENKYINFNLEKFDFFDIRVETLE